MVCKIGEHTQALARHQEAEMQSPQTEPMFVTTTPTTRKVVSYLKLCLCGRLIINLIPPLKSSTKTKLSS